MFHLMKTSFVAAASIFSHIILCVLAWSVGAITIAPFKFWWWAAGFTFLLLVCLQVRRELANARQAAAATQPYAATMSVFAMIWGVMFAMVWLLGQEGSAVMSRALETCLLVLVDLALKGGGFAYVVCAVESDASDKELQVHHLSSSHSFCTLSFLQLSPPSPPPTNPTSLLHLCLQVGLVPSSRFSTECI